jgi:FkbH-like protein
MAEREPPTQILESYLQADVVARVPRHEEFIGALRRVTKSQGAGEARSWARRAVSPLLDYSSLMALRHFVLPGAKGDGEAALRVAILGGPTTVQLRVLIEMFLAGEGIAAEIYEAEYGLFRQELLTTGSGLDAFRPNVVFLATSARDVTSYPALAQDAAAVAEIAEAEAADWVRLWDRARTAWNATVIQNNFEVAPGSTILSHPAAPANYLERLNRLLVDRAPGFVVIHDLRGLAAAAGARSWFDARFYLEFKMPCGAECLVAYAHSVVSVLRAMVGRSRKVLVLDLDNTLWGGVVGDLGSGGIRLGEGSGEGEAFLAFQRYAKTLLERGVLLAVCSKNDEHRAREPFEKREDMILKLPDFACFVANWANKADNMAAIARELNLKLDALVFVDDNPAERALVRRFAPDVAVPDMPEDASGYIHALALHRYFETLVLTQEDSVRTRYYADNARRRDLAAQATDLSSFLASLHMRMKVAPIGELNIERATQLINKSNQFNLTTRRYTAAQVREMASSDDWRTLTFSLSDDLGDNGLISVILLRRQGEALDIDTWVMSCRVLQRGVEQFARNEIVALARQEGALELLGTYVRTAKNAMVERHFDGLAFSPAGADGAQSSWSLRIDGGVERLPHHIQTGDD